MVLVEVLLPGVVLLQDPEGLPEVVPEGLPEGLPEVVPVGLPEDEFVPELGLVVVDPELVCGLLSTIKQIAYVELWPEVGW